MLYTQRRTFIAAPYLQAIKEHIPVFLLYSHTILLTLGVWDFYISSVALAPAE